MDFEKRIKWLFLITLVILIGAIFYVFFCLSKKRNERTLSVAEEYRNYCGGCHTVPEPSNIPKTIWQENVLPEMAARMGYRYKGYNPYRYSIEENHYIRRSGAYPEKPILDSVVWNRLCAYILAQAPDSVSNQPIRKERSSSLAQFDARLSKLGEGPTGGIVHIGFDDTSGRTLIGDVYGQLHEWQKKPPVADIFGSPVVSSALVRDTLYVTEIGLMGPSEIPKGSTFRLSGEISPIAGNLHRPVYSHIVDLDEDGVDEIILCEFGDYTGELSLLVKEGPTYLKKTLAPLPGAIKVETLDMDRDGRKDIVALFSQGREGIYVLYQGEDLGFNMEQLVGFPPEYGLSWFSLLDFNKDGLIDMVTANGDNADYSNFLKPYHGIRLFLNNGDNKFTQEWFYPINGATRVLAEDFDQDGDIDFAAMAFFPDMDNNAEEGFVYLENQDSETFSFNPYITGLAKNGNWLVMDKGDMDQDGDVDILLGNFNMLRERDFREENEYDLLYLENKTVQ